MKKKLFIVLSFCLLLTACKSNSDYKPGNVNNKETTKENTQTQVETSKESKNEIDSSKETIKEDESDRMKRTVKVRKELEISKIKRLNERKKKEVVRDLEQGKNKEEAPKKVNQNIDKLLANLANIANKATIEGHNFDEENVVKVASTILFGQRQEAYDLMKNVKHYSFTPYLTKARKIDEENYVIEITFKKNDKDMVVYSGYYNEAANMITIRNSYNTKAGSEYIVNYTFDEHGDGI